MKLNLKNITLLCVDNRTPYLSIWAMNQCLAHADFAKVILVTDRIKVQEAPNNIQLLQAPPIHSIDDYSMYMLSDLNPEIEGTHVLIMQWDSFIVNPNLWDNQFLEFDYIGAPWPHHPETPVGNGGFSLRSKKLIASLQDTRIKKSHPEDQSICIFNRTLLEQELEIRFAPVEIAKRFSFEREFSKAFGFHGFFNFAKVLSRNALEHMIEIIPIELLGKLDTYDLINDLLIYHPDLARKLLSRSEPKGKLWKRHLKLRLKLFFTPNKSVI